MLKSHKLSIAAVILVAIVTLSLAAGPDIAGGSRLVLDLIALALWIGGAGLATAIVVAGLRLASPKPRVVRLAIGTLAVPGALVAWTVGQLVYSTGDTEMMAAAAAAVYAVVLVPVTLAASLLTERCVGRLRGLAR